MVDFGKSRMWPILATTLYVLPRYFSIVFAFDGDSTITKFFFGFALDFVLAFVVVARFLAGFFSVSVAMAWTSFLLVFCFLLYIAVKMLYH